MAQDAPDQLVDDVQPPDAPHVALHAEAAAATAGAAAPAPGRHGCLLGLPV